MQPLAEFQSQLDPDPDHHFPAVHKQLCGGTAGPPAAPSMGGFVQSYYDQRKDVKHSRQIMFYFPPEKLPVLTTLARSYAVFNGWFSSIPGPTICNRAFAHYGTSFGQVGMNLFYPKTPFLSIYDRMLKAGKTTKLYYYDQASSTMEIVNLLKNQPQIFATYPQFLGRLQARRTARLLFCRAELQRSSTARAAGKSWPPTSIPITTCKRGKSSSRPSTTRSAQNPDLWKSTALLIAYDEHGGIYDHVPPPACTCRTGLRRPTRTPEFPDRRLRSTGWVSACQPS